ncbi:MAG: AAA family ATPase [Pseudomonadota bacterium]
MTAGARFRQGLVVGKFSPLHRGHEWLVRQAASACERLLVLSYSQPALPGCDTATRARWMSACLTRANPGIDCLALDDTEMQARCAERGVPWQPLPLNEAADEVHQRYLGWMLREVLEVTPDALFTSELWGPTCAQTLAQVAGRPVYSVQVDVARQHVPISATRIRHDPQAHRVWLSPAVWADFVPRVVLLGGESSGKTTLARALAEALQTEWVPEYGRELWERRGGHLDAADLQFIAEEQVRREDRAATRARAHLVCDTSPLTTLGYSLWLFGQAPAALQALAERRYALHVLCAPDMPFEQDGTRRDAAFRDQQHRWYLERCAALQAQGHAVCHVRGSVAQRVACVQAVLAAQGLGKQ